MVCAVPHALVSPASNYERWYEHFLRNRQTGSPLPWDDSCQLSTAERALVARSIQQFQLGEWANGRGLRQRASSNPCFAADRFFQAALDLFIQEEQGHSALLGRFLDREQIPRLKDDPIDHVFRRLRKMAGLEACVTVLVTAEMLALPFYRALRDATRSNLLRCICLQVLRDEAHHLKYQALTLRLLQRPISAGGRAIRLVLHSALFDGTALILWRQHRAVFRAAGWNFHRFWREAHRGFARLQRMIFAEFASPAL